jgi:hypothetical protein
MLLKSNSVKIILVVTMMLLGSCLVSAQQARTSPTPLSVPTGNPTPGEARIVVNPGTLTIVGIRSTLDIANAPDSKPSAEEVKKAQANKEFQLALQSIEADSKSIDVKGATKTSMVEQPGSYEISFPVTSGKSPAGESLIYSSSPEGEFVYFTDVNSTNPAAGKNALSTQSSGLFGGWSNWSLTGQTKCDKRVVCFKNKKKGTFVEEIRSKKNKKSQIRWKFVHCGC